ncbi:MAG: DUF6644 family protein [Vicinamibacterales bacterium]
MNLAHLHLLLNHVPTVGLGVGCGLFLASLIGKSEDLKRASFVVFFLVSLVAIPAYLTGDAARFTLQDRPEVSDALIAAHQDAAMLALIPMELTGVVAWIALWRFRTWTLAALLCLSILTFGLMARAATVGGQIRHPEIVTAGTAASAPAWPRPAAIGAALVLDHPWVWPICEILHFVGLCLLFGVVLLVNLRTLGFITGVASADMKRLLPWAMAGLGINVVTGMLFFLAAPDQYTQNRAFFWKMGVMLMGGLSLLYQTMADEGAAANPNPHAPMTAKVIAAGSIGLWIGVIFLGRFLPYLGAE